MKKPTELQQQKYERIGEIAAKGRQRYLEAGGDQKICPSGSFTISPSGFWRSD